MSRLLPRRTCRLAAATAHHAHRRPADGHVQPSTPVPRQRLALTTAGIAASLRANTAADIQRIFFDPIDKAHSAEMIAPSSASRFSASRSRSRSAARCSTHRDGPAAAGRGMCLAVGSLVMVFAGSLAGGSGVYTVLWGGALVVGIGWGLVETVINPLMTSALSGATRPPSSNPARVVAGRPGHRRPARRGDVGAPAWAGRRSWRSSLIPALASCCSASASRFRRPSAPRPAYRWARCSASC